MDTIGERDQTSIALIASQDDPHAFLLESLLHGQVDAVIHVPSPRAAIDRVMGGLTPVLVLIDIALYEALDDAPAETQTLRILADDAVVLEVGEQLAHSGDLLARCLRGNSLEVREWSTLRA